MARKCLYCNEELTEGQPHGTNDCIAHLSEELEWLRGSTAPISAVLEETGLRSVIYRDYKGIEWPGLFHCWCGLSEDAVAVIETLEGEVTEVSFDRMRFTDQAAQKEEG